MQLGQEFFRWEMATAVAGSVIGINPFDQPDVEASKVKTRELTNAYEKTGKLPDESPFYEGEGVKLFADPRNEAALKPHASNLVAALKAHLGRIGAGDYAGLLAYIEHSPEHIATLQRVRRIIRDRTRAATVLGFGPRFSLAHCVSFSLFAYTALRNATASQAAGRSQNPCGRRFTSSGKPPRSLWVAAELVPTSREPRHEARKTKGALAPEAVRPQVATACREDCRPAHRA